MPAMGFFASVFPNFYFETLDRPIINRFTSLHYVRYRNEAYDSLSEKLSSALIKSDKRARELGLVWLAFKQATKRDRRGRSFNSKQSIEAEKIPLNRRHSPRP